MLKKENIICISSIDWDFVWQGHQEIMSTFAKNGNRILFIENTGIRSPNLRDIPRLKKRIVNWLKNIKGFRIEAENIFVYSPVILPFPYSRFARLLNRWMLIKPLKRWMRATNFHDPIIWTFLPTGTALDIISNIDNKLVIYYCIADFYELADHPREVKKTENELLKNCDLIFAQGNILAQKCRQFNRNVHIFPFGVKTEAFNTTGIIPDDIKQIKKPIIGYIGGLHRHIDFKLIRFIAENNPQWSIVLIGPQQTDISEINNLKNIFLLGKKSFSSLPNYINEFTVGIIPYKISKYTETVFPTKLNEYHALGKPVISTDLPEVVSFNNENDGIVFISKNYREFNDCIIKAINTSGQELINLRITSSKKNSWENRIARMSELIEERILKKIEGEFYWKEKFINLYKLSRKRILKTSAILLSIYFLLFYSPLVWFIAGPLKIAQQPIKADCIIVFAGGVGESGREMQGYEERVQYAVDLYKQGFAKHLIFSSGYVYVFKEPLLMKVLALSLGVPREAIILEEKARNTYENVLFTEQILASRNWHQILLISSPYHMLRVNMVFKKIAPDIRVIYTPIPFSLFYSHGVGENGKKLLKQVSLKQIEGIIHEYLGLVYYYLKGYI